MNKDISVTTYNIYMKLAVCVLNVPVSESGLGARFYSCKKKSPDNFWLLFLQKKSLHFIKCEQGPISKL